jgi:hypothetical protein
LAGTPVDPDGHPYKLTPEGRVEFACRMIFLSPPKGLPPGYKPSPKYHAIPLISAAPLEHLLLPSLMMAENAASIPRSPSQIRLWRSAWQWWNDIAAREGLCGYTPTLELRFGSSFATPLRSAVANVTAMRNSIGSIASTRPARLWVGAIGCLEFFTRLISRPKSALFHEMLDALLQHESLDFRDLVFIDLGSGKGRTLLMASDYPFRRIVGVELLPALHLAAHGESEQVPKRIAEVLRAGIDLCGCD